MVLLNLSYTPAHPHPTNIPEIKSPFSVLFFCSFFLSSLLIPFALPTFPQSFLPLSCFLQLVAHDYVQHCNDFFSFRVSPSQLLPSFSLQGTKQACSFLMFTQIRPSLTNRGATQPWRSRLTYDTHTPLFSSIPHTICPFNIFPSILLYRMDLRCSSNCIE